jgi:hypothetical protein
MLVALRSRISQSTSPSYLDRISGSPEQIFSNPSKPIYRAEPARFLILGAFCGSPKSPWGNANDPFEVKTELALV